jgi:hypothetical protein
LSVSVPASIFLVIFIGGVILLLVEGFVLLASLVLLQALLWRG